MTILNAFDTHDIGRDRGGISRALASLTARTIVVAISSDIIFPPQEMKALARAIPGAEYAEIASDYGHDGFLVEGDLLNDILLPFMTHPDSL